VRIAGCRIESRDDAICLKQLALGRRRPPDVTVTGATSAPTTTLKLGTESSGDFRASCSATLHPWKGD
jgi:hypothetical protein